MHVYVHVCAYVFVYVYVNVYVHVYVYVTGKLLAPGAARERQRRALAPGSDGVSSQGPASLHHLPFSRLFSGGCLCVKTWLADLPWSTDSNLYNDDVQTCNDDVDIPYTGPQFSGPGVFGDDLGDLEDAL